MRWMRCSPVEMDWSEIDWSALQRLREAFLKGAAGAADYWQNESDLAGYDCTFAQRIGWKWDHVLAELARRGWSPPEGPMLDWGCGSGVAGRAFLDHFGADIIGEIRLWDRSMLAVDYAAKRAREKYPRLKVKTQTQRADSESGEAPAILLISHVLTELTPEQAQSLADFAAEATTVLWVEPGTYEASLTLIAIRERLRERFNVVSPCTHGGQCGILVPENERHWCHHFASPPPEIFTDPGWARFANETGIDLRDLPLSYLVLDKRPAPALPPDAVRVIGHPRIYKAHALLLGCDADGVCDRRLMKRNDPEFFRLLKKGGCPGLQIWRRDGDEIVNSRALE